MTLLSALTMGCAANLPPVALHGRPADLEPLAGAWSGEYSSGGVLGRSGSIMFTLVAGETQAHGDVMMTPLAPHPYGPGPGINPSRWEEQIGPTSESLTIRFVRVDGNTVSGALDPYWDPDRGCWATTTFTGRLVETTIAGEFRTTFSARERSVEGRWRVTRRPPR